MKKDIYKGKNKRCFILATGPSINQVDLSLLQNEITIGVVAIQKSGFIPDYMVVSDPEALERDADIIFTNNKKIKHFIIGRHNTVPFQSYSDQKMKTFNNKTIVQRAEKNNEWEKNMPAMHERTPVIAKQRYYIDPELKTFSGYGGSVVQDLAVPTAVYLGFEEIYLVGVDGGFSHFYAKTHGEDKSAHKWVDRYGEDRPAHNFIAVKNTLNNMNIQIYNCSPSDKFKELEYKELSKVIKS